MDDNTKLLIDDFIVFLEKEFNRRKEFATVQIEKWSLNDFKITIKIFYAGQPRDIYVDLREIKENKNHYLHLLSNIEDQINSLQKDLS